MSIVNSNDITNRTDTHKGSKEPLIISFHGTFGCGKSTTSKNIAKKLVSLGKTVYELHFAIFVKRAMSALTGIPIEDLFSREGKERILPEFGGELTVGRVSQIYANFNRDKFGHNFYNILMEKEIERIAQEKIKPLGIKTEDVVFIFDDARFMADILYLAGQENHLIVRLTGDPKNIYKNNIERDKNDQCEVEHLLYKNYDLEIDTEKNNEEQVVALVLEHIQKTMNIPL